MNFCMELPMRLFSLYLYATLILLPVMGCRSAPPDTSSHVFSHTAVPPTGRSIAGGQSIENAVSYLDDPTPIASHVVTLTVHGLGCPLCAGNIDKQLMRVPGIENVKVNLNDGTAIMRVDPSAGLTRSQLAKAIYESGFTLIKIDE